MFTQSKQRFSQQAHSKNETFKNQIRNRQRQQIFSNIRKHYQLMHARQSNPLLQEMVEQYKQPYRVEEYPLVSRMLEKYHEIPHKQIYQYANDIAQHLIENNIYLKIYQQQQSDPSSTEDEQSLLVHDLFYLTFQHDRAFKLPKKFKFIHNGSPLVASYVSLVSTQVMPEQLAYWANYMNQEDKQLIYLAVLPEQSEGIGQLQKHNCFNLHYQAWVNHPTLRNTLLKDFLYLEAASKAVRQIIGYRQVHPDRLKNSKGESLYELMCRLFHDQLQSMIKQNSNKAPKLRGIHLQISAKIIEAKIVQKQECMELEMLLNKILSKRVQSEVQLVTPLFCMWVINALLVKNIKILSDVGNQIIIGMITYDQNQFLGKGKVPAQKFKKFQQIIEREKQINSSRMVQQSSNNP